MTEYTDINLEIAIRNAAKCANTDRKALSNIVTVEENGMYHITFRTANLLCECYADSETSEIIGFSCEPFAAA